MGPETGLAETSVKSEEKLYEEEIFFFFFIMDQWRQNKLEKEIKKRTITLTWEPTKTRNSLGMGHRGGKIIWVNKHLWLIHASKSTQT